MMSDGPVGGLTGGRGVGIVIAVAIDVDAGEGAASLVAGTAGAAVRNVVVVLIAEGHWMDGSDGWLARLKNNEGRLLPFYAGFSIEV